MQPMQLFWLECTDSELPADEAWLSDAERRCFRERWVPKRQHDWLLGRWTAKCALARYLGTSLDPEKLRKFSVIPAESGAPIPSINGRSMDLALSISHCEGRALALIGPGRISVGCDVERVTARASEFRRQFFTSSEIEQVEQTMNEERNLLENLIWSAKETVLKILAVGLRVDTRCVSVSIDLAEASGLQRFSALVVDGSRFRGWWHREGRWIKTMAGAVPTSVPVALGNSIHEVDELWL